MIWALSFVASTDLWRDWISITHNKSSGFFPLRFVEMIHEHRCQCHRYAFFVSLFLLFFFLLCKNKKCTNRIQRTNESQVQQRFHLSKRNGFVRSFAFLFFLFLTVVKANLIHISRWKGKEDKKLLVWRLFCLASTIVLHLKLFQSSNLRFFLFGFMYV